MTVALYPLRLEPVYKHYIWGGTSIPKRYGRREQPGICAESWEASTREEGQSIVANGALAGQTLTELIATCGSAITGGEPSSAFPLLIKIIDSRQRLSVQVHPNNETAARFGGEPKTEMWYVLDAEPGAGVYAGLQPGVTPETFRTALAESRVDELLQFLPVTTGDCVFIHGGRVHAIGEGCLLLEVQQNSNTTYRVYDWGRVGHDGKPRELHIEQAMRVIDWSDTASAITPAVLLPHPAPNKHWSLVSCPHFDVERLDIAVAEQLCLDPRFFRIAFVEEGRVDVVYPGGVESLGPGTTCLFPAALADAELVPLDGQARVILIRPGAAPPQ